MSIFGMLEKGTAFLDNNQLEHINKQKANDLIKFLFATKKKLIGFKSKFWQNRQ